MSFRVDIKSIYSGLLILCYYIFYFLFNTLFKNIPNTNLSLTLKAIVVSRIVLKYVHIPATIASGILDEFGEEESWNIEGTFVKS
ncbi:MAG: hypothetical protein ACE1ZQ_09570, partial [Ignavibacteriaceae bacterium]